MSWELLPEHLLLSIFSHLQYNQIYLAGLVCRRWQELSEDDILWKLMLFRDYKLCPYSTRLRPGADGWRSEYKRLVDETPCVLSEEIKGHTDEVLHVSFSHSGRYFVTCSKDGHLLVWSLEEVTYKTSLRYCRDMKNNGWLFTWASRYNPPDTLLLVAGVIDDITGEIAIFDCTSDTGDYVMLAKVPNNPYDVMGAWCDDTTWLSGRLSEDPINNRLDATIHICNTQPGELHRLMYPLSTTVYKNIALRFRNNAADGSNYLRCLLVSSRRQFTDDHVFPKSFSDYRLESRPLDVEEQQADTDCQNLLSNDPLYLIFLCSGRTPVPHQLGFKRLWPEELEHVPVINRPDRILEMSGHIVGIKLDKSGRYLFVNVRSWADGAVPTEHNPPAIASEIEMRVVDLSDLTLVKGKVYTGHKGYTDSTGAFYIYLDTSDLFVASGSEDCTARVWDRHFCCKLATNSHSACVNCVAMSPIDSQIMVSVSDDKTVKIWKSRLRNRQQKL